MKFDMSIKSILIILVFIVYIYTTKLYCYEDKLLYEDKISNIDLFYNKYSDISKINHQLSIKDDFKFYFTINDSINNMISILLNKSNILNYPNSLIGDSINQQVHIIDVEKSNFKINKIGILFENDNGLNNSIK
jgi:hypothetical protein